MPCVHDHILLICIRVYLCRWIILITCWFLSLGLGWTHDRIQSHAPLFHLLSWGLPACLTITVLTLRSVDADELTGKSHVRPSVCIVVETQLFPIVFKMAAVTDGVFFSCVLIV